MPMYTLTECCSNYSETTISLWFYSKDEATVFNTDIAIDDNSKSFKYKPELSENTISDESNGLAINAAITWNAIKSLQSRSKT